MSLHNYTNQAFCQNSEFYPAFSNTSSRDSLVDNHKCRLSPTSNESLRDSTTVRRSHFHTQQSASPYPASHYKVLYLQNLNHSQPQQKSTYYEDTSFGIKAKVAGFPNIRVNSSEKSLNSGRYALVPVEHLSDQGSKCYAIVPSPPEKQSSNSRNDLGIYCLQNKESDLFHEGWQFHATAVNQFSRLAPDCNTSSAPTSQSTVLKHAFSSDFGSKSLFIVDKISNQHYQMVPTDEDEEVVDENQEVIEMHNGRAHRYAVVPTESANGDEEEETCQTISDLNQSQNLLINYEPIRTSTPETDVFMTNMASSPDNLYKKPTATKKGRDLLATPPKLPVTYEAQTAPCLVTSRGEKHEHKAVHKYQRQIHIMSGGHQIPNVSGGRKEGLPVQRLHDEKHFQPTVQQGDRTTAIITPLVVCSKVQTRVDDDSGKQDKPISDNSFSQKVPHANIALAVVSLMLVLGSFMNSCLVVYMIAHLGKSFYLQISLVSAFCGVGLGGLGYRARHSYWLPNRSYTSGFILVTVCSLLKCCGLLVILVFDPYPGLPLHDVTTGIILGLSTFSIFFSGLGVIGSLWCYRTPPDNRVNPV